MVLAFDRVVVANIGDLRAECLSGSIPSRLPPKDSRNARVSQTWGPSRFIRTSQASIELFLDGPLHSSMRYKGR